MDITASQVAKDVNAALLAAANAEKGPEEIVGPDADKTSRIAKILDIQPFRRSTYYWIAFIAQLCQLVLGIIVIRDDSGLFYRLGLRIISPGVILIMLASLLFYRESGNVHALAGHQYYTMRLCALMNAFPCIQLVLVPFFLCAATVLFPSFTGQKDSEDGFRGIAISFMLGFLNLVATVACFMESRIIYRSAVSARGTKSVTLQVKVDIPAWTLATIKEYGIYRRQGNGVKLLV